MKEFRYEEENLDKGEKTQKKEKKLRKKEIKTQINVEAISENVKKN